MPRHHFRPRPVHDDHISDDDYNPTHAHSDDSGSESSDSDDGSVNDPSEIKQPKSIRGMKSEIKNLYEGKRKCRCCPRWVQKLPKDTVASIKSSKEIQQYAVIVRYKRNATTQDGDLKVDSIVVQSPLLRPLLEEIFEDLPGVTGGLDQMQFLAPFVPFYHRWQRFQVARWETKGESRVHADLLYEALHNQVEEDIKLNSELVTRGLITFDHIWTLFVPGDLITCKVGDQDMMCTVSRAEYFKDEYGEQIAGFLVTARYIDIGRNGPGLAVMVLATKKFSGTVPISELVFEDMREESKDYPAVLAIPAKLHPDLNALKTRLIERGHRFEQLQGHHYKEYSGDLEEKIEGRRRAESIKRKIFSRIIVDAESFETNMHAFRSALIPLDADLTPQGDELLDKFREPAYEIDYAPERTTQQRIQDRLRAGMLKGNRKLTEEQLIICSPKVKGYCLKSKTWAEFYVDNIRDVTYHEKAFSSVVLPENYKELISCFVTRHMSESDTFDDIIPGKGKGLIVLLSGEPGVGKTLTAETVAEEMGVPLYSFGAAELGNFADDVEKKLREVLELCSRWKAVLLIDEADVFLEKRSDYDMERNKITSTWLRLLEYHEGMMFLTTNRVASFDPAFRSRIHVNLDYPPLSKTARVSIWTNFLKNKQHIEAAVTRDQIDELAERPMNGREIKNIIKVAGLLAGQKGEKLAIGHLATILKINGFDSDGAYVLENDFRVS